MMFLLYSVVCIIFQLVSAFAMKFPFIKKKKKKKRKLVSTREDVMFYLEDTVAPNAKLNSPTKF